MKFESNKKYSAIDMQEVSIAHVIPEGELFKVDNAEWKSEDWSN